MLEDGGDLPVTERLQPVLHHSLVAVGEVRSPVLVEDEGYGLAGPGHREVDVLEDIDILYFPQVVVEDAVAHEST